jgi:hypothetical protein
MNYNNLTRSNKAINKSDTKDLKRLVIGGVEFRKQRLQAAEYLQGENPTYGLVT